MNQKIFEVKNVSFSRLDKFPALCGVNLDVREKERIALLGANGSGKSSLLHILNGLVFPQEGEVKFLGQSITDEALRDEEFNSFFRKTVGLVFQNSDIQLFSSTVWDEIAFGPIQLGLPKDEVEERVNDLLKMLGIESLKERAPYQLSGGEKKKVCIAATLAVNPDVLLLDEPTNGLDPRTQAWLVELLVELHRAGKTLIIATHDMKIVDKISDKVLVMSEDHTVAAEGITSEILGDKALLLKVNLIHEHIHCHDGERHSHAHGHFSAHEHNHNGNHNQQHDHDIKSLKDH